MICNYTKNEHSYTNPVIDIFKSKIDGNIFSIYYTYNLVPRTIDYYIDLSDTSNIDHFTIDEYTENNGIYTLIKRKYTDGISSTTYSLTYTIITTGNSKVIIKKDDEIISEIIHSVNSSPISRLSKSGSVIFEDTPNVKGNVNSISTQINYDTEYTFLLEIDDLSISKSFTAGPFLSDNKLRLQSINTMRANVNG